MANIKDMLDDPEPLDENDPEVQEEMFELAKGMGDKPEDLVGATPEFRQKYREWLATHGA